MDVSTKPAARLQSISEVIGPRTTKSFAVLGNETRLAIMLALWDAYDPYRGEAYGGKNSLSFSEIYERVDYQDEGNFSYHLDKLTGQFVRRTDEGYSLRRSGRQIMYAVIAGSLEEATELSTKPVEEDCYLCSAPTTLTYRNEFLYHRCTECAGRVGFMRGSLPEGTLNVHGFPPRGLRNRTTDDILKADRVRSKHRRAMMIEGICPDCSGDVAVTVTSCDDHDPDSVCSVCGHRSRFQGRYHCEVCKHAWQVAPRIRLATQPAVIGFYFERGIEFDLAGRESRARMIDWRVNLDSRQPIEIEVRIPVREDTLVIQLDEDFAVSKIAS